MLRDKRCVISLIEIKLKYHKLLDEKFNIFNETQKCYFYF